MPYRLRKAPKKDLYWVVGQDGKKHSKEPIPRERAEAQMRALYANERTGGGDTADKVQNLLSSFGKLGSFLYNKTPIGSVVDGVSSSMEKAKADRDAGILPRRLSSNLGGNTKAISASAPPPPPPPRKGKKCDTEASEAQKNLVEEYKKVKRQRDMMESNRIATVEMFGDDEWIGTTGEERLNALNERLAVLENALMNATQLKRGCGIRGGSDERHDTLVGIVLTPYYYETIRPTFNRPMTNEEQERFRAFEDNITEQIMEEFDVTHEEAQSILENFVETTDDEKYNPHRRVETPPLTKKKRGGRTPSLDVSFVTPDMSDEDLEMRAVDDAHLELLIERRNELRNNRLVFSTRPPLSAIPSTPSSASSISSLSSIHTPPPPPPTPPRRRRPRDDRRLGGVSISKPAFIEEHKNLLGVLKRGKKSELRAEAKDQAKELAKVTGGMNPDWIAFHKNMFKTMSMLDIKRYLCEDRFNLNPDPAVFNPYFIKTFGQKLFDDATARNGTTLVTRKIRGTGAIPDRDILQQLATQSYQDSPANRIGQLELVRSTPTLKFYKDNGNTIVVAIRGTKPTDVDDVKADGMIALGQLEQSDRYKRDMNTIQQFQTQFPPSQYDYYGVGHSLGGAILDMFLKRGFIKNGVSYNPAVQPQDFQNTTLSNNRIYSQSDPLYALMGRNLAQKPETRSPRKKAWWEKALSVIPYAGTAMKGYDLYQSHMLDQFKGGADKKLLARMKESLERVKEDMKDCNRQLSVRGVNKKAVNAKIMKLDAEMRSIQNDIYEEEQDQDEMFDDPTKLIPRTYKDFDKSLSLDAPEYIPRGSGLKRGGVNILTNRSSALRDLLNYAHTFLQKRRPITMEKVTEALNLVDNVIITIINGYFTDDGMFVRDNIERDLEGEDLKTYQETRRLLQGAMYDAVDNPDRDNPNRNPRPPTPPPRPPTRPPTPPRPPTPEHPSTPPRQPTPPPSPPRPPTPPQPLLDQYDLNDPRNQNPSLPAQRRPPPPPEDPKRMNVMDMDNVEGGAKAHSKFDSQLRKVGIEPSLYLKEAQRRAKKAGLPFKVLGFADDGIHKLAIPNADGKMVKFGRVGYGDHQIYLHLEKSQKVPKGTADAKKNTFHKSHSAIKGDWKKDPFSANSLALKVLW